MPKVNIAKKDLFYNWMAKKNKLGGQQKFHDFQIKGFAGGVTEKNN